MNDACIEPSESITVAPALHEPPVSTADFTPERLEELAVECEFDIPRIAGRLGISQRHLQRRFRKAFACAPREWLREARLQKARHLLLSAARVKEVAHALGFRQTSQFCRDFKARFGCTPAEWKRGSVTPLAPAVQ